MTTAGKRCIGLDRPPPSLREWLLHCRPLRRASIETQRSNATAIDTSASRTLRDSVQANLDMRQKRSHNQTIGLAKHLMDQHWRTL